MTAVIERLSRSHALAVAALFALSLVLFLPGLFAVQPMDRDEPRFAQATRQMLESGDYIDIRFQDEARHKKPVGIYWLQAGAVQAAERLGLTGARDAIGYYRLPSLAGAIAVVLLTYWTALAFVSRQGALFAGALMAATVLLGVEARLAKTDAVLTATVVAAMGALARVWIAETAPVVRQKPGFGNALVFWLAIGIGVLIKGPITPLIPLAAAVILSIRERSLRWLGALRPGWGLLLVALIALPWLVAIWVKTGGAFFTESVGKDMLGKVGGVAEKHWGPPGAYFFAFWGTFWPVAPLVALALPFVWRERRDDAVLFLIAWAVPLWLVLEAMPTKLPHYVLPLFPALVILVVLAMERAALMGARWALGGAGLLLALIPVALLAGGMVAFARLDGAISWHSAVLALTATLLAGLGAWRLARGEPASAMVWALAATLPMVIAAYQFGLPRLESVNLSRRLADSAAELRCKPAEIATAGYREPSLVFLTTTDLQMTTGAGAAQFLSAPGQGCRIAFVESREEQAFRTELGAAAAGFEPVSRVRGVNINGGRTLDIGVFVRR